MKKLTRKQQRFVDAYMGVAAGNGSAAAFIAGYQGSKAILEDEKCKGHLRSLNERLQELGYRPV
ncbi:hypothetical protein ACFL6C_03545 [Myxococcota bacterium]